MTVAPSETWPSAAITTESPRRTQITVVERIRLPSARSSGWARFGSAGKDTAFTRTGDFAEEEKGGFIGTFQYIAFCLPPFPRTLFLQCPESLITRRAPLDR